MLAKQLVNEKLHEGETSGESVLSGFGSSCGSSTDQTSDQEEFIAELTRQMAENMLQEDDENLTTSRLANTNKPKPFHLHINHLVQSNKDKRYRHQNQQQRFLSSTLHSGSGMKVVFLGEIGSKNGSSGGTGVFIPYATNNLPDHQPRKKPGRCPTVLMPERVLHTLKQHFERRTANQAHPNGVFHRNHSQPQDTSNKRVAEELQLPQEWTY